ncbi:MAG: YgiQ family radical SAM protein [Methanobacteriota archaeon]
MIAKTGDNFDILLITGEYYDDHPLSPAGIIARVLDAHGFRVGVIEKPEDKDHYTRLGTPRLCYCITSGSIDSMVHNYTPLKRKRMEDSYNQVTRLPDRAIIVYCNKIKQYDKSGIIVIGGIEASLRRFAHYDYWDNNIRRSLLLDSRANILVYGNGEKQSLEIAERLLQQKDLSGIPGTCILGRDLDSSFELLPSFSEVVASKEQFCVMQRLLSNEKNLAQEYTNNYVIQYQYPKYTTQDLDWIYSLPYSRRLHPKSLLKMAQFSVVTHRGCIGNCSFCSLSLHQGERIISRSEESILSEIRMLSKHPDFKGYIDDLGGPSANMYGMDCLKDSSCHTMSCLSCANVDLSHERLVSLLKKARGIPGVKKIFVRSGIRYDLALESREYVRELTRHHISGSLKIAPEHFSENVLQLMNKDNSRFQEFVALFRDMNRGRNQSLRYYFMIGHPGDSPNEVLQLRDKIKQYNLGNIEQFQLFTPTPMTASTCMYWTGLNPVTGEIVSRVCDYRTKKEMKRLMLDPRRKMKKMVDETTGVD